MRASPFDQEIFFGAIAASGSRALLIGRHKRFAARPKDAEDVRMLEVLRSISS